MISQFVLKKKIGVLLLQNDIALFNVTIVYDILIAPLIISELLCSSPKADGFLRA